MGQRFEGRNLEEALTNAAQSLGVERYQVSYHVVAEKRGFLGGVKRLVIEAAVDPDASAPQVPEPGNTAVAPPPVSRPSRGARGQGRGGSRGSRPQRRSNFDDEPRQRDDRRGGPRRRHDYDDDIPIQAEQSADALRVVEWCEELFDLADLELVIRTWDREDKIDIVLYGRDTRRVLDRDCELLDSIQVVANKALVKKEAGKPLEFDCGGFKKERDEELRERALSAADRVRRDGREQLLPPMTPVERRIVHLTLQDDDEVATESRGDGFLKRVAIIPKAAPVPTREP